jgi:hypothetical protein
VAETLMPMGEKQLAMSNEQWAIAKKQITKGI